MSASRIRRYLRPDFDDLEDYTPVKPLDVLAAEIGVPVDDLVKLDANENLYGPIPEIRDALRDADLHIYPDPGQQHLRLAIAEYCSVRPEQVVAGSGADDLIDIIIRVTMPEAIVNLPPTFGMYSFLARISGARVIDVPRRPDFSLDLEGIAEAVERRARIVFATSPNNPSGNPISLDELHALCELDALIVVDEAYVEFGGESAIPFIAAHPNLVVLRTFSKWAGLAGLRVGYAICDAALAEAMMAVKQPYNVNVAGDIAARLALEHRERIFETVRRIIAERERLAGLLDGLEWLRPLPSAANFILCEVRGRSAADVHAALRKRGILVRYYNRPDLQNYIRISAGRPEDTDRLMAALRTL